MGSEMCIRDRYSSTLHRTRIFILSCPVALPSCPVLSCDLVQKSPSCPVLSCEEKCVFTYNEIPKNLTLILGTRMRAKRARIFFRIIDWKTSNKGAIRPKIFVSLSCVFTHITPESILCPVASCDLRGRFPSCPVLSCVLSCPVQSANKKHSVPDRTGWNLASKVT